VSSAGLTQLSRQVVIKNSLPLDQEVSLVPNPATDHVGLQVNAADNGMLTIILRNLSGNALMSLTRSLVKGMNAVDVRLPENIKPGMYLMEVVQGDGRVMKKLMVR
jgi:Secretion system C-terminal sorting domain